MSDIILKHHWKKGKTVHADCIAFENGRIVLLNTCTYSANGGQSPLKCAASLLADTTLSSILKYNQDCWVDITSLYSIKWDDNLDVICGEGAMGNEGFVAVKNHFTDNFLWVLFCSSSNPFTMLNREGEYITAQAGYDQVWRIPLDKPEEFKINEDYINEK